MNDNLYSKNDIDKINFLNDTCLANFYDKAYLINLDRSPLRLENFVSEAEKAGIDFVRFSAIDGNDILITNLVTNITKLGKNLKDNKIKILRNKHKHLIKCEPKKENGIEFYFDMSKNKYVPGELAIWCSNVKIWQDAKNHGYKNIVIFEDDVKFKNSNSIKSNINNFIKELPKTYDLAFYYAEINSGNLMPVPGKNCVQKASKNFLAFRAWVMIYSEKGISKLLDVKEYDNHLDLFFSKRDIFKNPMANGEFLDIYYSCYNDDITTDALSDVARYY